MDNKIKLLSVCKKKPKKENINNWSKIVERYAPNMYELLFSAGEKDVLKEVEDSSPEIILILPSVMQKDIMDGVELLQKIKHLSPKSQVFVNLGVVDEEQEAIDLFMANGAYKCYLPPIVMDSLFHDMYVALNLE